MSNSLQADFGEEWNPERHNALVDRIHRRTLLKAPGFRLTETPFGTRIKAKASQGGGFVSKIFNAAITRVSAGFEVRFNPGFIGGVKPTIGGVPIDQKGDNGKTPALLVKPGDFDPDEGVTGLYFTATVDQDFAITTLEPSASAAKPVKKPWTANKLAGFLLQKTGAYDRHLFSDLGMYAANRKDNGFFDALWFWES